MKYINVQIVFRIVCYITIFSILYYLNYLNNTNFFSVSAILFMFYSIIESLIFIYQKKVTFKMILNQPFYYDSNFSKILKFLFIITFIIDQYRKW